MGTTLTARALSDRGMRPFTGVRSQVSVTTCVPPGGPRSPPVGLPGLAHAPREASAQGRLPLATRRARLFLHFPRRPSGGWRSAGPVAAALAAVTPVRAPPSFPAALPLTGPALP